MCAILLAGVLLSAAGSAQNLVRNGDFSSATLAPWTTTGFGLSPGVTQLDVDGTGLSRCYSVIPGGMTNAGPFPPHKLMQPMTLIPIDYALSFDLSQGGAALSIAPAAPRIRVLVGTQVVTQYVFRAVRRTLRRERICLTFRPLVAGPTNFTIEFEYRAAARATGYRFAVDNIDLRLARQPQFCIRGERILGNAASFEISGAASSATVLFLSPARAPTPITISGWTGQLELDLRSLIVFFAAPLDTSGAFQVSLPVPRLNSLAGVPLHWQAVQITNATKGFGWASQQAFYL